MNFTTPDIFSLSLHINSHGTLHYSLSPPLKTIRKRNERGIKFYCPSPFHFPSFSPLLTRARIQSSTLHHSPSSSLLKTREEKMNFRAPGPYLSLHPHPSPLSPPPLIRSGTPIPPLFSLLNRKIGKLFYCLFPFFLHSALHHFSTKPTLAPLSLPLTLLRRKNIFYSTPPPSLVKKCHTSHLFCLPLFTLKEGKIYV